MTKINELSVNEQLVLKALKKKSAKNPLTRSDLKDITKLTDANNRAILGSLRDKGYRIISGSLSKSTKGYWLAKTDKEYKVWSEAYRKYALRVLTRLAAMDKKVKGQVSL